MDVTVAVLGDSIAVGVGASDPEDTVGARLAAAATGAGIDVDVHVLANSGARSDALAGQVRSAERVRPDVAVVIIGANDLTHFTPPPVAAAQLGDAVRVLRAAGAAVIVVPAPDLSVVPWVPPNLRAIVRAGSQALRHAQTVAAHAAGAVIVDIPTDAANQVGAGLDLFSPDRFHPSSAGYALLADAPVPAVLSAAERANGRVTTGESGATGS